MAYLNEATLRRLANSQRLYQERRKNWKRFDPEVSVFLSHSHSDKELVLGIINILGSQGMSVYVDWQDDDLPRVTGRETAEKLKKQIKRSDLFMLLATRNALSSKWVPWELGLADELKGYARTLIIPVADPSGNFDGVEYLQLYSRVVVADDDSIAAFRPQETKGWSLKAVMSNPAILA